MRKVLIFMSFSLLISAYIWGCGDTSTVIATVGSQIITQQEYIDYLNQKFPNQRFDQLSEEQRSQAVEDLIHNQLKAMEARELGLAQEEKFIQKIEQKENSLIAVKLPEILIADRLVSPELILAYAALRQSNLNLVLIPLGFEGLSQLSSNRTKEQTVSLARVLRNRIRDGSPAAKIAADYSDNSQLKRMKGKIPSYKPGRYGPELDLALSKASDHSVVGPVVSKRGIFIAKILGRNQTSTPHISEDQKQKLKWEIFNTYYRQQGDSLYRALTDEFRERLGWELFDQGIQEFAEILSEWAKNPNQNLNKFTDEEKSLLLGRIGNHRITVESFVDAFQGNFKQTYFRFTNEETLHKVVKGYIDRFLTWVIAAQQRGVQGHPAVKAQLATFEKEELVKAFHQYILEEEIHPTDQEMRTYYETHKDQYTIPAEIRIWEIALQDPAEAQELYQQALQNKNRFGELAQKHTFKKAFRPKKGDLGYQSSLSNSRVVQKAFEAGPHKIVKPFSDGKFHYVIKTGDIKPKQYKPFEDVKQAVRDAVKRRKAEAKEEEIMQGLKRKYNVRINHYMLNNLSQD